MIPVRASSKKESLRNKGGSPRGSKRLGIKIGVGVIIGCLTTAGIINPRLAIISSHLLETFLEDVLR